MPPRFERGKSISPLALRNGEEVTVKVHGNHKDAIVITIEHDERSTKHRNKVVVRVTETGEEVKVKHTKIKRKKPVHAT